MSNPRKDFRFLLELNGADAFKIQEVTPPTVEYAETKHGAPGNLPDEKTPGKMAVGDLVLTKVVPAENADTWAEDWFAAACAGRKAAFSKNGFLKELGPDAITTVEKWYIGDCWVKKIERSKYTAAGSNNVIQTVTLSVRYFFSTNSVEFQRLFAGTAAAAAGAAFNSAAPAS